MNDQLSLTDDVRGLVRNDHRDTAQQTARAARPFSGTARGRVLACIASSPGGMTDGEVCEALRMNPSTERPRRVECAREGWIEPLDITRPSAYGHPMQVWTVTDAGRAQLEA